MASASSAPSIAMPLRASMSSIPSQQQLPAVLQNRNELFARLKQDSDHKLGSKPRGPIRIHLQVPSLNIDKDSALAGVSWETTPGQLLAHVPKEIGSTFIVAKVNGSLWDLSRPLEGDCSVSFLSATDPEGRAVFWHSAAHILGCAAEHQYGCLLSHGPPTASGFFYDMAMLDNHVVKQSDWPLLEQRVQAFVKEKQPFERVELSKDDLRELFKYSKYKLHYIDKFVPEGGSSTVYRNGSLVDLCLGPHIPNTRLVSAFKIMANSSAYFLGDQTNDSLQRISGVAFPNNEMMNAWELRLQEAKARDHQEISKKQKLFWFSQASPGSPFLLANGTRIINAIQAMLREQYWERGYDEVQSPTMYNVDLWKQSGHWQHYQDDMFRVPMKASSDSENALFALKPMNCPGHCLMFASEERSYRSLPWRVADFTVLHRNEASGALSGMTRVRKFQQDDGHIFCTLDQVAAELRCMFDFMTYVYSLFGFPFKMELSTRPDSYLGKLEDWDAAEAQLAAALTEFRGADWAVNPGDGAFYGPKIDVTVSDALGRDYQCATIQLDFQLPQQFKLAYRTAEAPSNQSPDGQVVQADDAALPLGLARPVMIHRAVIGSFERFLGVTTEHFAGKWPFWLSPRQVMVIPVMKEAEAYAAQVQARLRKARIYTDVDVSDNLLRKKVANAWVAQYNFVFVVGAQERDTDAVNVRNRDVDLATQKKGAMMPVAEALRRLVELRDERRLKNAIGLDV